MADDINSESLIPTVVILSCRCWICWKSACFFRICVSVKANKPWNFYYSSGHLRYQCMYCSYTFQDILYINPWNYGSVFMCRIYQIMMGLIFTGSVFTLLLVAVYRYRKVCRPHRWQIKNRVAKLLCFIAAITSGVCSCPLFAFYEVRTQYLENKTFTYSVIVERTIKYALYYNIFIALIVFVSLCAMVSLYACILNAASKLYAKESCGDVNKNGVKGLKHINLNVLNRSKELSTSCSKIIDSQEVGYNPDNIEGKTRDKSETLATCSSNIEGKTRDNRDTLATCSSNQIKTETTNDNHQRRNRIRQIALAFVLVTVFFCISYIPFLSLKIFVQQRQFNSSPLRIDSPIAIRIAMTCVFINSMVNCFIYSCFDKQFRQEVGMLYKRLCRSRQDRR